jgi:hypothetical protein
MEHASVAAFARFTLQLASLGAPAELMAASAAAMQDEVRHARACFALARRHMDHDVGPGPLSIDGALADMDFRSIVLGTLHEGCIGETVAALEAAEAAEHCEDETARVVLRQIAIEEGQHAELAWRFVAWALEVGPANLVDCVREAFEAALAPTEPPSLTALHASDRELVRHGLFTPPLRAALRARVLSTVVAPCAGALLAKVEAERPRAPLAGSSKSAPGRAAVGAATHPAA